MKKVSIQKVCGIFLFFFIVPLASGCSHDTHNFKIVDVKEPTCVEKGIKKHLYCEDCKKLFDINTKKEVSEKDLEVAPFGHDFQRPGTYIKQPSCTEDGTLRLKCARCEATSDITIPAYGEHNFVNEVASEKYLYQLGDCTTKSLYYKSCPCGVASTIETFEGDYVHDLTHYVAKEPTNNKEGNIDFYSCSECEENYIKVDDQFVKYDENPFYGKSINLFRKDGKPIKTLPNVVTEYLKVEDDPATVNNEIAEYMHDNESKFSPRDGASPIRLSWEGDNLKKPFTVTLYKDETLKEVVKTIENINTTYVDIRNLVPTTYYYQVKDSNNVLSMVDSFSFESSLRAINTNNSIINFRDLGGWSTQNNKTIKYGLIYRTASWESSSKEVDVVINELGIKTEVDVRLNSSTSQHPIAGVNFVNTGFTDDYATMLTNETTIANIKTFVNLLADSNNYPLAYHCSAGADRTGLGSLIIESILGLNDKDIYRDYELTSFFNEKRLRSDVVIDVEGNYDFNPNGICTLPLWKPQFGRVTTFLLEPYRIQGDTISDSFTRFLINRVGVTQDTLNNIKNILLA